MIIQEIYKSIEYRILINRLILDGRRAEVQGAATDAERRKELYKEYNI